MREISHLIFIFICAIQTYFKWQTVSLSWHLIDTNLSCNNKKTAMFFSSFASNFSSSSLWPSMILLIFFWSIKRKFCKLLKASFTFSNCSPFRWHFSSLLFSVCIKKEEAKMKRKFWTFVFNDLDSIRISHPLDSLYTKSNVYRGYDVVHDDDDGEKWAFSSERAGKIITKEKRNFFSHACMFFSSFISFPFLCCRKFFFLSFLSRHPLKFPRVVLSTLKSLCFAFIRLNNL